MVVNAVTIADNSRVMPVACLSVCLSVCMSAYLSAAIALDAIQSLRRPQIRDSSPIEMTNETRWHSMSEHWTVGRVSN